MTKITSNEQLRKEAEQNPFLTPENRRFLLENSSSIPENRAKDLLMRLRELGKKGKSYLELAIEKDPGLAGEMRKKSKELGKKVKELIVTEEQSASEKELEEEIRNL